MERWCFSRFKTRGSNLNKRTSDNKQTKTPSALENGKNDPERNIHTSLARYDECVNLIPTD